MASITVVFVHGWSVTNLDTYGDLPTRLSNEGKNNGVDIDVKEIFLGRYISFHDEVRLPDISRAFKTALADQLSDVKSFVCITHSTGGPVIRDWWSRYCKDKRPKCSMSHLIMLAPANFGSALAVLGKGVLSRLKSWTNGIEPGQGVLDWLCLGSAEAWDLNMEWILSDGSQIGPAVAAFFPFVITGQSIDREFYDHLNSYTGETGSDGVVRVASANMVATYIKLEQPLPTRDENGQLVIEKGNLITGDFRVTKSKTAPDVPLRIVAKKSHSGSTMGIMNSVRLDDEKIDSKKTVNAILDCIKVKTKNDYEAIRVKFEDETRQVLIDEKVELVERLLLSDQYFIHDRYTMIIFRVTDSEGHPVNDYDLLLTGDDNKPDRLPKDFFVDRQQNKNNKNTVTYFLNYDIMNGSNAVPDPNDKENILRAKTTGIDTLGIIVTPRPDEGFVKYIECKYQATRNLFNKVLNPNSTTMIDIVLQRVVDKEVFRMEKTDAPKNFKNAKVSNEIVE